MMHIGAYDDEPASVAQMDAFLRENGSFATNGTKQQKKKRMPLIH